MKSGRHSNTRSAQAFRRRILGKGGHRPERSARKAARRRASRAIDLEKVLHFSQQLYAHALTLQELIRNEGEATYEVLRPRYDRQAAQQFEIFYHSFKQLPELRTRSAGSYQ